MSFYLHKAFAIAHAGELKCEIPVVISNHPDLEEIASSFGVPFRCFPLPAGSGPDAKRAQVFACLFMYRLSHFWDTSNTMFLPGSVHAFLASSGCLLVGSCGCREA